MQALLSPVGKVEIKPNILAAKWTKLVVNAMCLGPFAMVGLTLYDALKLPGMRELIIEIGEEAMRVGHDLGHPVEPIFGLTPADLAGSNRPAEKLFDTLASHVGPGRGRNTVLQDLLKGRASEVDMINGRVVEESERRGYAAPANARVVEIVRQIEAGALKPAPANMELALVSIRQPVSLMPSVLTRRHALALMGSLVPAAAFGAAYPDRPIKLVVALAAGGPADTAARVFAPHFAEALGQSVFIENRTGASSVIGTEAVVRAAPDGYTLLFGSSSSFAVNPAVMKNAALRCPEGAQPRRPRLLHAARPGGSRVACR